ncbi:MAG: bacteriohemerythrin [Syntrophobacteraceae bacterium]
MIRKLQVSPGVFWIEVPEAGLRVLCGCPADSVKLLIKKGLITEVRENGYIFETGPNAILLSDTLIQNGVFSNLAEFPVLQMLYKQGMAIPNHPGNSRRKPLLIGSGAQLKAQKEYIYRGNYGLCSYEELQEAGADPPTAWSLFRMKQKFAFGKIRQTDELIESLPLEKDPVEIGSGVYIQRLRLNVFEFRFGEESVLVDLNLAPAELYDCPYSLGFHSFMREYFAVVHSGDGDGWDITRPSMSSIVVFQGKIYLVDAGPNVLNTLSSLGIGINEIEGIFHTHAHDDHFAGLPSLMQADHRIKYYATKLVRVSVAKKLSALLSMSEDEFDEYFETIDLTPDKWNDVDMLEVRPSYSFHPVETNMYFFRSIWAGDYRVYAHLADIADLNVLKGMIVEGNSEPGITQEMYDSIARTYSEPADLKKVDAGGGMIHGNPEDFKTDTSKRLIFSHMSLHLSANQKQIGSGAQFGAVDILIPASEDYLRAQVSRYLKNYSPNFTQNQIGLLLNSPIRTFAPRTFLFKTGETVESVYMILSGEVEFVGPDPEIGGSIWPGTFIGEIPALLGVPLTESFMAATFVYALEVPLNVFRYFAEKVDLKHDLAPSYEKRGFLKKTRLFGGTISMPVLNRIVRSIGETHFKAGEEIQNNSSPDLFMIREGKVELCLDTHLIETLHAGDFFAEQCILFKMTCLFRLQVVDDTLLFRIPGDMLLDIPAVRWKLLETHNARMQFLLDPELAASSIFEWREEYGTNIQSLDEDHKKLFKCADDFFKKLSLKEDVDVEGLFHFLAAYAERHFRDEEQLMMQYSFPGLEQHQVQHRQFFDEISEVKNLHRDGSVRSGVECIKFLRDWVIRHILTTDRQYGKFLNEKGVF